MTVICFETEVSHPPPTLEEIVEILDAADSLYDGNKTFPAVVARLGVYITNICLASFDARVPLFIRFIKIFIDDWQAQCLLMHKPSFRAVLKMKVDEIESAYLDSDLPGIPGLMEQAGQIKHIIEEIENHGGDAEGEENC